MSTTITSSRTIITTIVEGNKTTTTTEVTVVGDPAALEKARLEMEAVFSVFNRFFVKRG